MSAETSNKIALNIISGMLNSPCTIPETIVKELNAGLGGQGGYVFVNRGKGDDVLCLYSSDRKFYTVNRSYTIEELPDTNQMEIFHRNDLAGIISFPAEVAFEHESYEELVRNVICVALSRHAGTQDVGHFFEVDIYREVIQLLRNTLQEVNTIAVTVNATRQGVYVHNQALERFRRQSNETIGNALLVIYDALDYIGFEENTVTSKASEFDLKETVQRALQLCKCEVPITVADAAPSTRTNSDPDLVLKALINIIRRVSLQLTRVEMHPTESVVEIILHLSGNVRVLEDIPKGHKDLPMQLAQIVCRHLGGDLVKKGGTQIIMTLRGLSL